MITSEKRTQAWPPGLRTCWLRQVGAAELRGSKSAAGVPGPGVRPAGGDPHTAGPSDMNTVKRLQPGFPAEDAHTQEGGGLRTASKSCTGTEESARTPGFSRPTRLLVNTTVH